VWICALPSGHLQATGRDARGRKQYRYHAEWNVQRNADKFSRLEAFGRALPAIRRRVARDLAQDDTASVAHRVVLATLVRLLDTIFARVGNEAYVRQNCSFGLTTLRNRHAEVGRNGTLRFSFRGKSGVRQDFSLDDARIARVVRRCKQLPGQELFRYEDQGVVRGVGSGDVNDYLSDAAGERFTAKDFRTWHGTVEALELARLAALAENEACSAQHILVAVARRLGNTVAVCRKSYVHPQVLALVQAGDSAAIACACDRLHVTGRSAGLHAAERRLLNFLAQQDRGRPRKRGRAAA
jgi:DNA topoisomerase-1